MAVSAQLEGDTVYKQGFVFGRQCFHPGFYSLPDRRENVLMPRRGIGLPIAERLFELCLLRDPENCEFPF